MADHAAEPISEDPTVQQIGEQLGLDADTVQNLTDQTAKLIEPETFDTGQWLAGAAYAEEHVEIYNDARLLKELSTLVEFVEGKRAETKEKLEGLELEKEDITSEGVQFEDLPTVREAIVNIQRIREALKGTGADFHMKGFAPGERDLISAKIARGLKAKAPVYENDENGVKVIAQEGHGAGTDHPDFNGLFEAEVIRKSITHVVFPSGAIDRHEHTVEEIKKFSETLHPGEYRRLANLAFGVNYFSYQIDSLVTADF